MRQRLVVIVLAILYSCTLTWLSFAVPFVFTSPDENANFTFARTVMATGDFGISDPVNIPLDGIVHPRSVVVVGMMSLPGSFIGWPLIAGWLGNITGATGILLLTPFLVLVALWMWWDIARRLTGDVRFAAVATALLAVHPALWYYANRSMMHNVPFVCMLIAAVWVAYARPFSRLASTVSAQVVELALAGVFVGTAIFIRTSEALWVAVVVVVLAAVWRRHVRHWSGWVALLLGIALPLAVMAGWQAHVYGGPLVSGYTVEDVRVAPTADSAGDIGQNEDVATVQIAPPSSAEKLGAMLLPFGLHPRAMLKNIWHYGIMLFPWMTVLAAAGMVSMLTRKKAKREKGEQPWRVLLGVTLGLAVWLGLVYGSWSFNDNPDPTAITIGDSHIRYWLPLFVLSTLFAARAIVTFVAPFKRQTHAAVVVVVAIAILSGVLVFGGPDGLLHTRSVLFASAEKRTALIAATEDDAILVVDRADKFLFPYRRVIQPLRSESTYAALPEAARHAPLYYYGIPFPETDMTYLNTVKLAGLGLRIDPVVMIHDEMLYRITRTVE